MQTNLKHQRKLYTRAQLMFNAFFISVSTVRRNGQINKNTTTSNYYTIRSNLESL
jgi:hypothetical protein